jgi:hypothetical protein
VAGGPVGAGGLGSGPLKPTFAASKWQRHSRLCSHPFFVWEFTSIMANKAHDTAEFKIRHWHQGLRRNYCSRRTNAKR